MKLAFASETPVDRGYFVEVLDLSRKSMRTGRLTAGANLLCDHDTRDVVAVVESVEIGSDKVARAVVRFGRSARAEEVFRDREAMWSAEAIPFAIVNAISWAADDPASRM